MDQITNNLPFKPTLMGFAVFVVAVAATVYVAKKIPVINKLV